MSHEHEKIVPMDEPPADPGPSGASNEPVNLAEDDSPGVPRFEVFEGVDGAWRFRLVASNYEIVCQSEGYTSSGHACTGAATVKRLSQSAEIVVVRA